MATDNERDQPESAGVWVAFKESTPAVKAILAGVFINRVGSFLTIFLVLYLTARGYSGKEASVALGAYGAGAVVGVLIGGVLAGRLGARNTTVLSMVSTAAVVAALLYLPNFQLLLGAVTLCGLASQVYRPASAALMADLTPDDRQILTFALYRFALNVGTTAAPLVGFGLYNLNGHSYTVLFWGEAAIALAYAVLAWIALPSRTQTMATTKPADESTVPRRKESSLLRDRRYLLYLTAALFGSVVYIQPQSTLPLEVSDAGIDIFWYTLAASVNGFIVIAFELPLTRLTQHWRYRWTVGLSFGLIGTGVAFYGLPFGPAVILAGTLIWTIGEIVGGPAVFAYPAMAGPATLRSRYIGSFQFMWALGAALGPVIGGSLYAGIGHAVWPVTACFAVLATILGVTAVNDARKAAPDGAREPDVASDSRPTTALDEPSAA